MKVAIYARTMTMDKKIEEQVEACQKYIVFKKAELHEIYIDEGKSGIDTEREGLRRLIKAAENKDFDIIVTCGHERLFREIPAISNFLHHMKELGISHSVVQDL